MHELFTVFFLYFASFFSLINPLGSMPVFLAMTNNIGQKEKRRTALKATLTAFVILIIFAFAGQMLFTFFGISVDGFRVVGGIIFFLMGYDMLNAKLSSFKTVQSKKVEAVSDEEAEVEDISITPLAIPMIAGPGAITNAIVLMQDSHTLTLKAVLVFTIMFILALTYVIYVGGASITRFLGPTGNKILLKIMGLILMVVAVEFFFAGLGPILRRIFEIGVVS